MEPFSRFGDWAASDVVFYLCKITIFPGGTGLADVFISYARENSGEAALVELALQNAGLSVWRDTDLKPRDTWDSKIEQQLRLAKAVVVIWTPHSVRSEWVRIEAEFARRENKLIPAVLHRCDIPIAFSLIQAVDLRDWQMDDDDRRWPILLDAINQLVRPPAPDGEANFIQECKWTGWRTDGGTISQGFKHWGSQYNFEMSVDWVTEKSGIRIPGMPVMTLRMFFMFFSIGLDEGVTDLVLMGEDRKRSTGPMPARAQHTDNGGTIVGLLARSDANKVFEWLARGEDLVAQLMVRDEAVLVMPIPFAPGLQENYEALRKRLR